MQSLMTALEKIHGYVWLSIAAFFLMLVSITHNDTFLSLWFITFLYGIVSYILCNLFPGHTVLRRLVLGVALLVYLVVILYSGSDLGINFGPLNV